MNVSELREKLGVSRAVLARFLGVSEATVARWESDAKASEPRGLAAVLVRCVADACEYRTPREIARIVRSCSVDHRAALKQLLEAAGSPTGRR